jgi:hypothetical protein
VQDPNGVRYLYCDETWKKDRFTFDPPPTDFIGYGGPSGATFFHRMPTFLTLFRLFWPDTLLRKISVETNRYATTVDGNGKYRVVLGRSVSRLQD